MAPDLGRFLLLLLRIPSAHLEILGTKRVTMHFSEIIKLQFRGKNGYIPLYFGAF